MHKSYNYKTLNVISTTFNALLFLGMFILMISSSSGSAIFSGGLYSIGGTGTLISGVLMFMYYSNKEHSPFILYKGIINIILPLLIYIFSKTDLLTSGYSYNGWFVVFMLLALVSFLIDLFAILRLDEKVYVTNFDHMLPSNTLTQVSMDANQEAGNAEGTMTPTATKEPVQVDFAGFFKSKSGKIVIAIVAVIVVAFAGYKVWDNFFNYTVVDAFKDAEMVFDGYDGEGRSYFSLNSIDYDSDNDDIEIFMYSVTGEIEGDDSNLSNGDKVKVVLSYSESEAKALNIKFKEESKEYEVEGLVQLYKDAASLDQNLVKKALGDVEEYIDAKEDNERTLKSVYYTYPEKQGKYTSYYDYNLYFVFEGKEKSYFDDKEETRYYAYKVNFNSGYDVESNYLYGSKLTDEEYNYITDEKDILKGMERLVNNSKIKIEEVQVK